jgi:trehalose synthase
MLRLENYKTIFERDTTLELELLAERLKGQSILHVNSTAIGGGVAELLNRIVPMNRELGVDMRWEVMKGGEDFYAVTKKIHNALHGRTQEFTRRDFDVYEETVETNLAQMNLDADIVFIHDPQPLGFVKRRKKNPKSRWIWRCHIDLSHPQPEVWDFMRPMVEQYDACVFSAPQFAQTLSIPQYLIAPSIDPLSDKNRDLTPAEIQEVMDRLKIPTDKPLVTQVSRFDHLKDPLGVIDAYSRIRQSVDARLLLVGGPADDDPEGAEVLKSVQEKTANDSEVIVLSLPPTSNIEINAIQRMSTVVLQKSLQEGFGLTVSEALWKSKPVIAGAVGGIPLQITHKHSGILVYSVEGTAYWIKQLLWEPAYARRLGKNGHDHVRQNFLISRQIRDELLMYIAIQSPEKEMLHI